MTADSGRQRARACCGRGCAPRCLQEVVTLLDGGGGPGGVKRRDAAVVRLAVHLLPFAQGLRWDKVVIATWLAMDGSSATLWER